MKFLNISSRASSRHCLGKQRFERNSPWVVIFPRLRGRPKRKGIISSTFGAQARRMEALQCAWFTWWLSAAFIPYWSIQQSKTGSVPGQAGTGLRLFYLVGIAMDGPVHHFGITLQDPDDREPPHTPYRISPIQEEAIYAFKSFLSSLWPCGKAGKSWRKRRPRSTHPSRKAIRKTGCGHIIF